MNLSVPLPTGMLPPRGPPPPPTTVAAFSNTVLLTHLPESLHDRQRLRQWLVTCGNARNIQFVPSPVAAEDADEPTTAADGGDTSSKNSNKLIAALLTMSHADAAVKVVTAFRHFKERLLQQQVDPPEAESENKTSTNATPFLLFQAHLVPTHPDIPLPPPMMDPKMAQVLGEKLLAAFPRESPEGDEVEKQRTGAAPAASNTTSMTTTAPASTTKPPQKSAATESDDEDDDDFEDPLQSPAVLQAVREFRRKLARQQGSKATRRQELVRAKIEQLKPIIRERMQQEKQQPPSAPPPANLLPPPGNLPPPPPPPATHHLPPPPQFGAAPNLPPPPLAGNLLPPPPTSARGAAAAPRGVSNLPAWMTQQQSDAVREPPAKRTKTMDWNAPILGNSTAASDPQVATTLRTFVADQIKHYLGEEEVTLIDFVCNQVLQTQTTAQELLPELRDVLDEDAPRFLEALWHKAQELQ